ncbi:MAG TPA: 30S ribosome-binding factor RbfA [Rhodothermales bacterium]|nr:30S ribosome-binding factor RbfA [Rhodothermales bacterium]
MSIRTERVGRLIQQEVADLLQGEFHEGSHSLTTVTGARVTPDLSTAYVNVSVLGDDAQREAAFKWLEALTPQLRRALASRVRHQFKRVPELKFFLDDTPQHAARMDELFAKIASERPATSEDEEDGEEEDGGRGDY